MSEKKIFRLVHEVARRGAAHAVMQAPEGWVVTVSEPTRSLDQNALLWPLLDDISKQVEWYGNRLSADEWKDVLTAALRKEKVVPGINGGFVVLGQRTSKMGKREFAELVELVYAFGAQQGVRFRTDVREVAA
jgi:hypothetical protein